MGIWVFPNFTCYYYILDKVDSGFVMVGFSSHFLFRSQDGCVRVRSFFLHNPWCRFGHLPFSICCICSKIQFRVCIYFKAFQLVTRLRHKREVGSDTKPQQNGNTANITDRINRPKTNWILNCVHCNATRFSLSIIFATQLSLLFKLWRCQTKFIQIEFSHSHTKPNAFKFPNLFSKFTIFRRV